MSCFTCAPEGCLAGRREQAWTRNCNFIERLECVAGPDGSLVRAGQAPPPLPPPLPPRAAEHAAANLLAWIVAADGDVATASFEVPQVVVCYATVSLQWLVQGHLLEVCSAASTAMRSHKTYCCCWLHPIYVNSKRHEQRVARQGECEWEPPPQTVQDGGESSNIQKNGCYCVSSSFFDLSPSSSCESRESCGEPAAAGCGPGIRCESMCKLAPLAAAACAAKPPLSTCSSTCSQESVSPQRLPRTAQNGTKLLRIAQNRTAAGVVADLTGQHPQPSALPCPARWWPPWRWHDTSAGCSH